MPPKNEFGFKKSPDFSCYDYMLTCDDVGSDFGSGPAVAIVEIKCRNYNHDDFDSYKISKRKEGHAIFEDWYSDMNSYIQSGQVTKTTWGRVDRKDPMDVETAYEIPMSLFRVV